MVLVQQPAEDRGGEDLVAGQQHWPVLDLLVGSIQCGVAPVAVADETEEETGLGGTSARS